MTSIRVRFIVTGACLQKYFGTHFYLLVPLTTSNGQKVTVSDVEAFVRKQWPSELSEMSEDVETQPIKMLKSGKLLKKADLFEEYLNANELRDCTVAVDVLSQGNTTDEEVKASIIMHLVFQRKEIADDAKDGKKDENTTKLDHDHKNKKTIVSPNRASPQSMPHGQAAVLNSPASNPANETTERRDSAQREGQDVKDESCCCIM